MSIRALISRLFLSNAHAEEKQALHDWHKDTKTNLDELKNWIDVHHLSDQLKDYKEVDKKAAWSVVEAQTTGRSSNIRVLAIKDIVRQNGVQRTLFIEMEICILHMV